MMDIILRRPVILIVLGYIAGILIIDHFTHRVSGAGDAEILNLPEILDASGMIAGDPEPRAIGKGKAYVWTFPFRVRKIYSADGTWEEVDIVIRASLLGFQYENAPEYGETWKIQAKLREYANSVENPSARLWEIGRSGSARTGVGDGNILLRMCYSGRRRAADILSLGIESHRDELAVMHAILLGYRSGFSGATKKIFASTGTLHIFAISGLHVGIIAWVITWVLGRLGVSRVRWVLFLAPALVVYTIATGGRASAVRACIMMITYYMGSFLGRKPDIMASLAFSALLILLFDPGQIFEMSFIYSFVVMLGIVMFVPLIEPVLNRYLKSDPMRIQPEHIVVRGLRMAGLFFAGMMAVSVGAWVASTPLTMYFFQRVSAIGLISNLVVIPLAFLIVATGCVSLVAGLCLAPIAIALNNLNLIWVIILTRVMKALAAVPFGDISLNRSPGVEWLLLFYSALVAGRLLLAWRGGMRCRRNEQGGIS